MTVRPRVIALIAALVVGALVPLSTDAQRAPIILATTTSTQDSGLLDVLVPLFEKQTGYSVKAIGGGTGQSLALAGRGEADVALCHAPSLEKKYVDEGKLHDRRLVMYNDFVIIGPAGDPAKIKGTKAADAMKAIGTTGSRFVSRGDNSGTHVLEKSLWKLAGIEPKGEWYIESGQGMGATLGIADDRNAYTITDRATFLAFQKRVRLPILVEGDRPLLNVHSGLEVARLGRRRDPRRGVVVAAGVERGDAGGVADRRPRRRRARPRAFPGPPAAHQRGERRHGPAAGRRRPLRHDSALAERPARRAGDPLHAGRDGRRASGDRLADRDRHHPGRRPERPRGVSSPAHRARRLARPDGGGRATGGTPADAGRRHGRLRRRHFRDRRLADGRRQHQGPDADPDQRNGARDEPRQRR